MPLFIDRHDVPGATADAMNEAHFKDLEAQGRHSCKALTYWFDEARGTGFCLIDAPSADAVHELHRDAHGFLPNAVVEVDAKSIAQFLGRVADPEGAAGSPIQESAFRAIMFIDMVGSTQITRTLGDSEALPLIHQYREVVRRALSVQGGREVDRAGDGFLTSFDSAYSAVTCAIDIQRRLSIENAKRSDGPQLKARIGIGAGEPVMDGDALFGSTVNLTSRICDQADPEEILAARVVRELCIGKSVTFTSVGRVELKGFDEPAYLERIEWRT